MTEADWYPAQSLDFHQRQVLWIIAYLDMFWEGNYPPEPDEYLTELQVWQGRKKTYVEISKKKSAYISSGKKHTSSHAPFEDPAIIYAVVSERLDKTRLSGKLLVAEIKAGYTLLSDDAQLALDYISGWRDKR